MSFFFFSPFIPVVSCIRGDQEKLYKLKMASVDGGKGENMKIFHAENNWSVTGHFKYRL